jgi:hypothetical protein
VWLSQPNGIFIYPHAKVIYPCIGVPLSPKISQCLTGRLHLALRVTDCTWVWLYLHGVSSIHSALASLDIPGHIPIIHNGIFQHFNIINTQPHMPGNISTPILSIQRTSCPWCNPGTMPHMLDGCCMLSTIPQLGHGLKLLAGINPHTVRAYVH